MNNIVNMTSKDAAKQARRTGYDPLKLLFFNPDEYFLIETMAQGMSEQEILDNWGVLAQDLPAEDLKFFMIHVRKGRAQGKTKAVNELFKQMSGRNGKDAALAYLLRFAESWPEDVEDKAGGKTYKLIIE